MSSFTPSSFLTRDTHQGRESDQTGREKTKATLGMGRDLSAPSGYEHGLDSTARAAWEAGYFPEHDKRPDINHLLDAIREELGGNPRYDPKNVNEDALQFRKAVDDLDGHLTRMDIDPKRTSAKDIRAAIEKAQAEGEGREFGQDGGTGHPDIDAWHIGDPLPEDIAAAEADSAGKAKQPTIDLPQAERAPIQQAAAHRS